MVLLLSNIRARVLGVRAHNDAVGAGISGIIDFLMGKIMTFSSNVPGFEPRFVLS